MSTSENAGKVMLGADGCVLRGHDGKIVLADNYYPISMTVPKIDTLWRRNWWGTPPLEFGMYSASPADAIMSQNWATGDTSQSFTSPFGACEWEAFDDGEGGYKYRIAMMQEVVKWTYGGAGYLGNPEILIPLARVKAISVDWLLDVGSAGSTGTHGVYAIGAIGTRSATAPSGSNEPWDGTGWTRLAEVEIADQTGIVASGTHTITDIDASNPTFYAAVAFDEYSGPDSGRKQLWLSLSNFRVAYNLAT